MIEEQNNSQKEGFQNLKTIHGLQTNGAIQNVLRDLRNSRHVAEQIAKQLADIKRTKGVNAENSTSSENESTKDLQSSGSIETNQIDSKADVVLKDENNTQQVFENQKVFANGQGNDKPNYERRPYDGQKKETFNNGFGSNAQNRDSFNNTQRRTGVNQGQVRSYSDRPNYNNNASGFDQRRPNPNYVPRNNNANTFTPRQPGQNNGFQRREFNPNGQQRPYNNNIQNGQQRPYNNMQNGQRTYNNMQNGQQRPYNPNGQQRPFNPNGRPNNGLNNTGFNRPSGPKSSFVASKGNSFKSFDDAPVLKPMVATKNFANKNKTKAGPAEEKNKSFVKKSQQRNNIIIEDDEGFSETTMGSRKLVKNKKKEETFVASAVENAVITSEEFTVKFLSEKTGRPVNEIIKKLMMLGIMATINSTITYDVAELVAGELGVTLEKKIEKTYEEKFSEATTNDIANDEGAVKRPPIVTVMGHVDHGKTSLLDAIRNASVVTGEAGGITQHIGAYQITKNNEKITFIDTPGHAAFTAMRARGAKATDIAILVVAADDGIMPQTVEAINHIKAAKVPMIVAINKIDKPEANLERCKQQLAEHNVLPEEWGGDAIIVPVSAKTHQGIDEMLSMILLVAEMQELKANPTHLATGVVLEASLDKNKGPMATILVQNGTLNNGDTFVCGLTYGKVRAMYDENGKIVKSAGPSCPVSVLGFNEVPNAGDVAAVIDEKFSKKVIEERKTKIQIEKANSTSGVSLDDFMNKVNEGKLKNLNIIIKADVQGSVEALNQTLSEVVNEEAKVVCLHAGAGAVTESDVLLASASSAIIIAFNVKTQPKAKQLAEQMKIEIKEYSIIYEAVDDLTLAINGMLTPKYEERVIGHSEVRLVFKLTGVGMVAGSYITDGKAQRKAGVRVYRGEELIGESTIESLKIQKDDKPEVPYGYECGIRLKDSLGLKEGDKFEIFVKEQIKRA